MTFLFLFVVIAKGLADQDQYLSVASMASILMFVHNFTMLIDASIDYPLPIYCLKIDIYVDPYL
jgi:hypothetical protein